MEISQMMQISVKNEIPVVAFSGNCKVEGIDQLCQKLHEFAVAGHKKFVFDFSCCKLINSPAMGEILEAILLIDRDFEGHVVVCGLDSLKETLFSISGIIPIAQPAPDVIAALGMLADLEE
ncbi:MAG: hypothetical protein PHD82_08120 [Candidatus Riflebacteria bacterium]|nr:hypothetical protein [Candidatus Riflebacteria bacterium]